MDMFPPPPPSDPFLDQFSFKKSSSNFDTDHHQINPTSKQEFFNFPSHPIFDEHDLPLNQILSQTQIMASSSHHTTWDAIHSSAKKEPIISPNDNKVSVGPTRRRNPGAIPRKRNGKKDRHSKICTAHGIRDRRMRLSLQVARKFFDLQDMLGYDKASKTIEWLFTKSKKAIKELSKDLQPNNNHAKKSQSFVSECEGVSGIEENSNSLSGFKMDNVPLTHTVREERKMRRNISNMRELREKARARARCRTREKMIIKRMETDGNSIQWWKSNPNSNSVLKLGSCFEGFDQESISSLNQERVSVSPPLLGAYHHQFEDVGTIEKLLQGNSSSSTNSSCPNNINNNNNKNNNDISAAAGVSGCIDGSSSNFMEFLGSWELLNSDRLSSTHYVADQVPMAESPNSIYSNFPFFH